MTRQTRRHRAPAAMVLLLVFTAWPPGARGAAAPPTSPEATALPGYIRHVPPESAEARAARHAAVARRLAGTPILVHRGASKVAPENTLEAYAAAMDRGADGVEIDIRRSADGVLFIMHDAELGRTIEGQGPVKDLTYHDLLRHRLKTYGTADASTGPPTLAAVLHLARHRAMLLHLDIKEPGIDGDVAKLLDEGDVWDHVVHINDYNSDRLRGDPRFKPLGYKGWLEEAGDTDADRRAFLARPPKMIFVGGDPADAAKLLGRPAIEPVPLPGDIRSDGPASGPASEPQAGHPLGSNGNPPASPPPGRRR